MVYHIISCYITLYDYRHAAHHAAWRRRGRPVPPSQVEHPSGQIFVLNQMFVFVDKVGGGFRQCPYHKSGTRRKETGEGGSRVSHPGKQWVAGSCQNEFGTISDSVAEL